MFETIEEYFRYFFLLPPNGNFLKWKEIYEEMAVHTRKKLPKDLLLKRRPNEEEHVYNYRLNNYEAITYGSMNKALDDLYRILNGISYSINAPDETKAFIATLIFEKKTLEMYLQKDVLKRVIEDPNGFLVWYPTGEGLINSSTQVIPQPLLVYSCQYKYSDENIFTFLSEEKSPLSDGKKISMTGDVYWIFTKTEFWKMKQVGTLANPKWAQELIYTHNLGVIPIITLGGDKNSNGYYESYFSPYLAFGNEAIRQFSDWQAVMTTSSFPYIEEFGTECEIELIQNLNAAALEGNPTEEQFPRRAKLIPIGTDSPYNKKLRKVPSDLDKAGGGEGALDPAIPSRRYIHPDINVAKYSGESWQLLIDKAEQSLNIDMTVGVNQSGVAKQIDKESQYSMITKIGNNFFDNVYLTSLKLIQGYLSASQVDSTISINKPATFCVKNENDLINEMTTLKEKDVPSFFLAQATLDLAKKRFNGNPVNEKIFKIISLYDPLYIYTTNEKGSMLASTVIDKKQYIYSIYMFSILNQITLELTPEQFLLKSMEDIYALFIAKMTPLLPQVLEPLTNPDGTLA